MTTGRKRPFRGIYPMLYAFFGADGRLDREAMRRQAAFCLEAGVHGVAALGLGTEVDKLAADERLEVLDWAAEDVGGRLPLAVTVYGDSVAEQSAFAARAKAAGADWLILQPPRLEGLEETALQVFFGEVMASTSLPVAIQNAPEYLGVGLSATAIQVLSRDRDNFVLLKAEGSALSIEAVIAATEGRLAVFNGRNGLELPDNLRAGCAGMIPSPDTCDRQARIFDLMAAGDPDSEAEAERLYGAILPALTFVMQSLPSLHCYGKRILARRLGLPAVYDRPPGLRPSDFGLACVDRYARALGAG